MFLSKFLAATKTHILYSIALFFESRAVYDIMCKNIVRAGHFTYDSMAHALCMLGT